MFSVNSHSNNIATSSDLNLRQFVINTISKENYDQLSAAGQLQQNQLYFVIDAPIDANNVKIANVAEPESSSDAATKNYVDQLLAGYEIDLAKPNAVNEALSILFEAFGGTVTNVT